MRLFAKIFLGGTLLFTIFFGIFGYYLINSSFKNTIKWEIDYALKRYQYDKFMIQAGLIVNEYTFWDLTKDNEMTEIILSGLAAEIEVPVAFFSEDTEMLYSEINEIDIEFVKGLMVDSNSYQIINTKTGSCILTGSQIIYNGRKLKFVTKSDVSTVVNQQEALLQYFKKVYCIVLGSGMFILMIFSIFLTRPLELMTLAANRIAGGFYNERLKKTGKDEIGKLSVSFNQMAGAVEEKIMELSNAAKQNEDFVANFAHELKTPLTSIIGYADMLYQKEMPREEVKKAAWYIWNEGMRLEALSLKLMDLSFLNEQDILLQEMPANELLKDVIDSLVPVLKKKAITISLAAENAYIKVEYDLFKTLMINLLDNSIKANSNSIQVTGKYENKKYKITLTDNGCGIPEEEIPRITEAFYMVDKSRSRKQHGAGLGLALAAKIAKIHGVELHFTSIEMKGTSISFDMPCEKLEVSDD